MVLCAHVLLLEVESEVCIRIIFEILYSLDVLVIVRLLVGDTTHVVIYALHQ
jgi:hypothetical protein